MVPGGDSLVNEVRKGDKPIAIQPDGAGTTDWDGNDLATPEQWPKKS
jgi:hypothetical protein